MLNIYLITKLIKYSKQNGKCTCFSNYASKNINQMVYVRRSVGETKCRSVLTVSGKNIVADSNEFTVIHVNITRVIADSQHP